jgi:hypothetical protein
MTETGRGPRIFLNRHQTFSLYDNMLLKCQIVLPDYHSPFLLSLRNNTSACITLRHPHSTSPCRPNNFLHSKILQVSITCHFRCSRPKRPLQTLCPRPSVRISNVAASRTKPSMPYKTSTSITLLLRPWRTLGLHS